MEIIYLVFLFLCFLFVITNIVIINNFLVSYFVISAIITVPQIISNSYDLILKASNLYGSIVIIGSIIGLIITSKNYKYFVLIMTLMLLFCSYTFNLYFYTNNYVFTLEIVIFIFIGIYKGLYKQFYFYLFIILLSGTFINNNWLNIIVENREILHGLKHIELYNIVSCFYLITFYIIFIIYHVKYRVNK